MKLERKMIGLHAEIEFSPWLYGYRYGTPEYWKQYEESMEREARDFREFVRDHRSRDEYGINIVKEYSLYCPFCEHEYPDDFNGIADCCEEMMEAQGVEVVYK
jgi:hypothetical protein